jgi:hypothetical protein
MKDMNTIPVSGWCWQKNNIMSIIHRHLLFALAFFVNTVNAQTIVKMDLPSQADDPLSVVTLFDETLPGGIPVVLGLMGFDVEGGITPYQYSWLLNGTVVSTEDIVVFTPQPGDDMVLQVTDQNHCTASVALNLITGGIPRQQVAMGKNISIYPTVFEKELFISYPETIAQTAHVRIFNMAGVLVYGAKLQESGSLQLNLTPGTYLVSVKTGKMHQVEKITAQ